MDVVDHEMPIRLICFVTVFTALAGAEVWLPRRQRTLPKLARWRSNWTLVALNAVAARIVVPLSAVGIASLCHEHSVGLFNYFSLHGGIAAGVGFLVLDLAIYLQHVLFHAIPVLWRLHQVHHADLDFDVSTGLRFHTIEILLSLGIKLGVVALFGVPALAVLFFEVALNATAMFNHANLKLPLWLDRILRFFLVTPDMHRVHHSAVPAETDSNFGFNLPWWDFLFGTYRDQPAAGHEAMTVGLAQFRDIRTSRLWWMLTLPFIRAREQPEMLAPVEADHPPCHSVVE